MIRDTRYEPGATVFRYVQFPLLLLAAMETASAANPKDLARAKDTGRIGECIRCDLSGADLREQLLGAGVHALDAVLFTHDHADHTHGIDDLRMVAYAMKKRIDCYFDGPTRASVEQRFAYCFRTPEGSSYVPILCARDLVAGTAVRIEGGGGAVEALPVPQLHGDMPSLGFRFGGIAYSPDVSDLEPSAVAMLEGLDVWIVDALRPAPHPSHFNVKQALAWIEILKPRRAVLTHMTTDLDYETLRRALPPHVEPAYDGMVIAFE